MLSRHHRDLLFELVRTDFKLRYNNSALGFVWVLLKPLLLFTILYGVFSFVFQREAHYGLSLLLRILLFSYFSEGTSRGLCSLVDRAPMILKVRFPRNIIVLVPILNAFINFSIGMLVFFLLSVFATLSLKGSSIVFVYCVLLLTMVITGFALAASILYAKFRDTQSIWEVLLSLLFYSVPIIYPITILPLQVQRIVSVNPLAVLIEESTIVLINGGVADLWKMVYATVWSVVILGFGYWYFKRNSPKIAEFL